MHFKKSKWNTIPDVQRFLNHFWALGLAVCLFCSFEARVTIRHKVGAQQEKGVINTHFHNMLASFGRYIPNMHEQGMLTLTCKKQNKKTVRSKSFPAAVFKVFRTLVLSHNLNFLQNVTLCSKGSLALLVIQTNAASRYLCNMQKQFKDLLLRICLRKRRLTMTY